MCYVGETLKSLAVRISQHKYCIRSGNLDSAVFRHITECNHRIDWNSPSFIFKSKDKNLLRFVEALRMNNQPNFNRAPAHIIYRSCSCPFSFRLDWDLTRASRLVLTFIFFSFSLNEAIQLEFRNVAF